MVEPTATACEICLRPGSAHALRRCTACGKTFDDHCSAVRAAEAGGYWMEKFQAFPEEWAGLCKNCFEDWITGEKRCPCCGAEKTKREFFWGGSCPDCHEYVCLDCVRGKKQASGGWEAPQGLWTYKCKKHTGFLSRGWQPLDKPDLR